MTETVRRSMGRGAVADAMIGPIVAVDTILLALSVEMRKGYLGGSDRPLRPGQPVLYVDCGLHKDGAQARQMSEWFADRLDLTIVRIGASEAHMEDVEANLADLGSINYHQVAVVGPDFEGRDIKLYRNSDLGAGDSPFAARGEKVESVPARRLAALLGREGCHPREQPVLPRMNIEGAEQFVIADLITGDAVSLTDGYYGGATFPRSIPTRTLCFAASYVGEIISGRSRSTTEISLLAQKRRWNGGTRCQGHLRSSRW